MLLEDERKVLKLLSMYGTLHLAQIKRFLHNKPDWIIERILQTLKREDYIHHVSGKYAALDKYAKPDMRLISAVWVLLQFIEEIDSLDHYPASYPAQIFFLKRNGGYEIIVLSEGEEHLLRLLQPQDDTKYIVVLPSIEAAEKLSLPEAQCLMATVSYADGETPDVKFYSEGEDQSG